MEFAGKTLLVDGAPVLVLEDLGDGALLTQGVNDEHPRVLSFHWGGRIEVPQGWLMERWEQEAPSTPTLKPLAAETMRLRLAGESTAHEAALELSKGGDVYFEELRGLDRAGRYWALVAMFRNMVDQWKGLIPGLHVGLTRDGVLMVRRNH